jgi:hypothetical protein
MPIGPMECLLCVPNSPMLTPMTSTNVNFQQRARGVPLGVAVGDTMTLTVLDHQNIKLDDHTHQDPSCTKNEIRPLDRSRPVSIRW